MNGFEGALPTQIGRLTGVVSGGGGENGFLSSNQLSSVVPTELGMLTSLYTYLQMNDNSLTGTVPTEIGSLTTLRYL